MSGLGLSEREWAKLRDDAAVVLPETGTIRRRDPDTGKRYTPAGLDAVPCRVALTTGRGEQRVGEAATGTDANARLSMPAGTDVRAADLVMVGGRRFEVVVVDPVDRIHRQAIGRVT